MNNCSTKTSHSLSSPYTSKTKIKLARAMPRSPAMIEYLENRTLLCATISPITPATTFSPDTQTVLGTFGIVDGKKTTLKITLDSNHIVTFSLSGGTATALQGVNGIDLQVTDLSGSSLTVSVTHGGTINLGNIDVTGNLKSLKAPTAAVSGTLAVSGTVGTVKLAAISGNVTFAASGAKQFTAGDLSGTLTANGNVTKLTLGNVTGNVNVAGNISTLTTKTVSGTLYTSGSLGTAKITALTGHVFAASLILKLTVASISNATILAGANLGSDGLLGGSGSATDSFASGTITSLTVTGTITTSFIGAGVNPTDAIFGNGNDTSAGTGLIKSISAKTVDANTRFESAAFGVAKFPKPTVVTTDPRFIIL